MVSVKWTDIGVNLTNKRFDNDREQVLERALNCAVVRLIVTGTNLDESIKAEVLCRQFPTQLFSTAGCHPHDAKGFTSDHYSQLKQLLNIPSVVAVGECGLDFNRNFSPPDVQLKVFEQQLKLAVEVNKPLFLHERDAFEPQLKLLTKYRKELIGGVVHCFTGTKEQLLAYLDLDLYIGITGWVCDERRGQELREIVHLIPNNRLLLETDAPYLLPRDLRPKPKSSRNLPEYLPHIAKVIANLRGVPIQELSDHCQRNTKCLFRI